MDEPEFFFAHDYATWLRNFSWRPRHPHRVLPQIRTEPLGERLARLRALHAKSWYGDDEYAVRIVMNMLHTKPEMFRRLAIDLAVRNSIVWQFPEMSNVSLTEAQSRHVNRILSEMELRLQHEDEIREHFFARVLEFVEQCEDVFSGPEATLSLSISDPEVFEHVIGYFCRDADHPIKSLAFSGTVEALFDNFLQASDLTPQIYDEAKHRLTQPSDYDGDCRDYIQDTGLEAFFDEHVPFRINRKTWLEHAFIAAPSGHGKTQLLQALIYDFLRDDPPGMFVIDSQGTMLKLIKRICPEAILLTPDTAQLNLFQLGGDSRDANINELFTYLFSAIDADLTSKQGAALTYLLRLMTKVPEPTIHTLLDIVEGSKGRYDRYIAMLDATAQGFFERQFYGVDGKSPMRATREQLARRLYTLLGNPLFAKMFAAKTSTFDPYQYMQQGKIVLLDTSENRLGTSGSPILGRFYIAQILAAAYRRPENHRPLTMLIVDEASSYFDEKTEMILSRARKFGLGFAAATQFLDQMSPPVKASVFGNTAIKMVGPVSSNDAMMLSREMYTEAGFIRSMKKYADRTEFACYVRGQTDTAVRINVPFLVMENAAKERAAAVEDAAAAPSPDEGSSPGTDTITPKPASTNAGSNDFRTSVRDDYDPSNPTPVDDDTQM